MLTEAQILEINQDTGIFKIRIPLFETIGSNQYTILTAALATPEGIYANYKVGDMVFVGFERNKAELPIILGKIYRGLTESRSDKGGHLTCEDLVVSKSAVLPANITISGNNLGFNSVSSILQSIANLNLSAQRKTYCCSFDGEAYYDEKNFINISFRVTTNNYYATAEAFTTKFADTNIGFTTQGNNAPRTLPLSSIYLVQNSFYDAFAKKYAISSSSDVTAVGLYRDPNGANLHKIFIRLLIRNTLAINCELKIKSMDYCVDMTNL